MKYCGVLILFFLVSCASHQEVGHPSGLLVEEIHPDKMTAITKQNLFHLAQVYDLEPFLYTKRVRIQSHVKPKSHPVILLNTNNAEYPKKFFANFLHQELFWWLRKNVLHTKLAVAELKKVYPRLPISKTEQAKGYETLIVCYLEFKAMGFYLGRKEASEVMLSIMKKDKSHPWMYYQVFYKDFALKRIIEKYNLVPEVLN